MTWVRASSLTKSLVSRHQPHRAERRGGKTTREVCTSLPHTDATRIAVTRRRLPSSALLRVLPQTEKLPDDLSRRQDLNVGQATFTELPIRMILTPTGGLNLPMTNQPTEKTFESLAMQRLEFAERALAAVMDPAPPAAPTPAAVPNLASLLLVVSAQSTTLDDGRWQFAIETAAGDPVLEAEDCEHGDLNRLTLLAAVRGLEAIDGPSGVTLLSHNRYLIRSLTDSLPRWRRSDFVWDHFGRRVEVQHADLWRRIDHALGIHAVQACLLTARMVSRPDAVTASNSLLIDGPSSRPISNQFDNANASNANANPKGDSIRIESTHASDSQSISSAPHSGNRLRDWLLQSAVDTSQRAHRIAMIGQNRP